MIIEPTGNRPKHAAALGRELEERAVTVSQPGLSDEANHLLTREVREVIGKDHVFVPHDRPCATQEKFRHGSRSLAALHDNRLLVGVIVAAALVLGAILALLSGSWWVLALAVVVLLLATYGVVSLVYSVEDGDEQPAATTVALLEEEGVRDPERLLSDLVEEFTEVGTSRVWLPLLPHPC